MKRAAEIWNSGRGKWRRAPGWVQITGQFIFEILLPAPFVLVTMLATRATWTLAGFMATYTAIGFSFAILLRIVKQHRQETGFQKMRLLLDEINAATVDLIGHSTGGDSRPRVHVTASFNDSIEIALLVEGKFALPHVRVEVHETYTEGGAWKSSLVGKMETSIALPGGRYVVATLPHTDQELRRVALHVFWVNGSATVRMVITSIGSFPYAAKAMQMEPEGAIEYDIPVGFPRFDPDDPEAIFKLHG